MSKKSIHPDDELNELMHERGELQYYFAYKTKLSESEYISKSARYKIVIRRIREITEYTNVGEVQWVFAHTDRVALEWHNGICETPCDHNQIGIGACTCRNIYRQKHEK
jgi:hypothetical protein